MYGIIKKLNNGGHMKFFLMLLLSAVCFAENSNCNAHKVHCDYVRIENVTVYNVKPLETSKGKQSIFAGVDVDKLLEEAFNGNGRYSKAAKLAKQITDLELASKEKLLFDRIVLEEVARESSLKTTDKLKEEIENLYKIF